MKARNSPDGTIFLLDRLDLLGDWQTFTGEERLVAFQVGNVAIEDSTVGGDDISVAEQDGVSGHDFFDGDDFGDGFIRSIGMTYDGGLGCADRFKRGNSL